MTQLSLPIILGCDPRKQALACRELARIVKRNRESYETRRFIERRTAMLKHTRRGAIVDRSPKGRDGETRPDAKRESAGLKGIAQHQSRTG